MVGRTRESRERAEAGRSLTRGEAGLERGQDASRRQLLPRKGRPVAVRQRLGGGRTSSRDGNRPGGGEILGTPSQDVPPRGPAATL